MRTARGFTLIELIITATIFAMVAVLLGTLTSAGLRTWNQNRAQADAQENARTALAQVSKLIREATSADNGSYAIAAASNQSLTFFGDWDNNGSHDQIHLFLQGTQLKLGVIAPTGAPATYPAGNEVVRVLTNNVQNGATAVFSYYDENFTGSQAALIAPVNIPAIRIVHLKLIIDADTAQAPSALTLETSVSFRNLKDNL